MRTSLRKALVSCLLAAGMLTGNAFATGTQFGKIQFANGQVPAREEVSFIAFINGSDDVIHTENAYNSPLGAGNGYLVKNNEAFWLVNFSNFADAKSGDTFEIQFTTNNSARANVAGVVPGGLTQTTNTVNLAPAVAPLAPTNVRTARSANGVEVTWNSEPNVSYRVYRADLPSGADNGLSRGIYNKVAENVNGGSFVDANTEGNQTYWYLVVAEDKNGVLSAHSGEVRALPASQFVEKPQVAKPSLKQSSKVIAPAKSGNKLAPTQPN